MPGYAWAAGSPAPARPTTRPGLLANTTIGWVIMTAYRPRELTPLLREALGSLPVVVVTGLRQAGKTTLLATDPAFAGRRYLTLDDLAALEAAQRDPEALIAGEEPVTVDEVQRCPGLLLAVKRAVDRRREPGRVLLSRSASSSPSRRAAGAPRRGFCNPPRV